MPERRNRTETLEAHMQLLTAVGADAPTLDEKLEIAARLRRQPETSAALDRRLLELATTLRGGLMTARSSLTEARRQLERLSAPPHLPATYLGAAPIGAGRGALVAHGQARRIVPLVGALESEELAMGDEVLLNQDLTVVVARSPLTAAAHGELACFERMVSDDRMLVSWHDEKMVIGIAAALRPQRWEPGDLVRWDRHAMLAFERIEREQGDEFILERVPDLPLDRVGGQDEVVQKVIASLTLAVAEPEIAAAYGLRSQRTILLHGAPGTGKTLIARAAAAHVQRLTGRDCSISVVKPGAFENEYVGVTQRRIRECFGTMRSARGFGILFLDEIESIGRRRGGPVGQHADKFLAALLAELQGFERGAEAYAVIAATNRLDLLDQALVDRMELQLPVGRPTLAAARAIFSIHLPANLPFAAEEGRPDEARPAMIEHAVSTLYGPNADNGLCTVRFRDASERRIAARELASGRMIEQICKDACQTAAFREVQGGEAGITGADMDDAVADAIVRLAGALTRSNVHHYLTDLPQDVDVVAVEPVSRRVRRPHAYRNVA